MRKILGYSLLFLLILAQNLVATDKNPNEPNDSNNPFWTKSGAFVKEPNDLSKLLQTRWGDIISVIQKEDIDEKVKKSEINKIITPVFDFQLMAKLALGKKNWLKLTPPQREKFSQLFMERLKNSYLEKIKLYTNEKSLYKPIIQKKKKIIYVPTKLTSKENDISIIYKLRESNKFWKIYDVEIEGISILLTYQSQFDDILSHGSVDDLLSKLEQLQPSQPLQQKGSPN